MTIQAISVFGLGKQRNYILYYITKTLKAIKKIGSARVVPLRPVADVAGTSDVSAH